MKKTVLIIISIVFFFFGVLFVVIHFGQIADFLFGENANHKGELLKLILSTIGGLIVLFGLYYTIRRTKALEENAKTMTKSLRITERGQNIDRLNNAIEHFNSNNNALISVGLIELLEIAESDFKQVIVELLRNKLFELSNNYIHLLDDHQKSKTSKIADKIGIDISNVSIQFHRIIQALFNKEKKLFAENYINIAGIIFPNNSYRDLDFRKVNLIDSDISNSSFVDSIFPVQIANMNVNKTTFIGCEFIGNKLNFTKGKCEIQEPFIL